jgi:hypothetical protein
MVTRLALTWLASAMAEPEPSPHPKWLPGNATDFDWLTKSGRRERHPRRSPGSGAMRSAEPAEGQDIRIDESPRTTRGHHE